MELTLVAAAVEDTPAIAALRCAVARDLTERFGQGHWSSAGTKKTVRQDLRGGGLYVVRDGLMRDGSTVVATLVVGPRKPWAIALEYFTPSRRPLYLTGMAVLPELQRQGVGRSCLAQAVHLAGEKLADSIRLDAYDAPAGAGSFYAGCGFAERGRVAYRGVPLVYYERLLPAAIAARASSPTRDIADTSGGVQIR